MNITVVKPLNVGDVTLRKMEPIGLASLRQSSASRPVNEGGVLTQVSPTTVMANSAEELTLQFSDEVEARETALEVRISRNSQRKMSSLRLDQVQAIMRLIEGKDGYELFRSQARLFSAQFRLDPEGALKQLDLQTLSPEKKYALMNFALNTVGSEIPLGKEKIPKLSEMDAPFADSASFFATICPQGKPNTSMKDSFFNVISVQPTIVSIWNLINESSGGSLSARMSEIQSAWNNLNEINGLEQVGALIILHKTLQVIRSMTHLTEVFIVKMAVKESVTEEATVIFTKKFIDIAQTSMPSTLIDKLVETLRTTKRGRCVGCGQLIEKVCSRCGSSTCKCKISPSCNCQNLRFYTLSLMHWYARQWPIEVWANMDAKKATLEQLLRKQDAPTGLAGRRMMP